MADAKLKYVFIQRLSNSGIEKETMPGFIRSLANSIFSDHNKNVYQVKRHLRYMGWDDIELDDHTIRLAKSIFEMEGLEKLEYKPSQWFKTTFFPADA
jgi:hypothetical protein